MLVNNNRQKIKEEIIEKIADSEETVDELRKRIEDIMITGRKVMIKEALQASFIITVNNFKDYLEQKGLDGLIEDYIDILYDDFGIKSAYWEMEEKIGLEEE